MFATPVGALSSELLAQWESLTDESPDFGSPFLHPAYARAVADVRSGVEVAVITVGRSAAGFIPYERSRFDIGVSVGSKLCDTSGAVVRPDVAWDVIEVTRAAGLRLLRLSNVPTSMEPFRPYLAQRVAAPFMDVSGGFQAYRKATLQAGSARLTRIDKQTRRMEADLGPLRLEWHDHDDAVFETLLRWKGLQRRATRTPNVLTLPWARALLDRLRAVQEPGFGGVLSALYAGDTLCAAHFGMRTRRVLQYWIPAYDEGLGRYSPGMILLLGLARAAAERGIERVELGPGDEAYKLRTSTGSRDVARASAATGASINALVGTVDGFRAWSRTSKLGGLVRAAMRRATRVSYLVRSTLGEARGGS